MCGYETMVLEISGELAEKADSWAWDSNIIGLT